LRTIHLAFLGLIILIVLTNCSPRENNIYPGEMIYDINGLPVNAHGGGILKKDNRYYLYGEYRVDNLKTESYGVGCYSSDDMANWRFEGIVLQTLDDTTSMLRRGSITERPKVLYNKLTDKYVMWFHHELANQGYRAALTGLAVADAAIGPFQYIKSIRPNAASWPANYPDSLKQKVFDENIQVSDPSYLQAVKEGLLLHRDLDGGQMSRDMTLYQEGEKAYHIHSAEENRTLHISALTNDYLDFTDNYIRVLPGGHNEAPAIFKHNEKHYMVTSGCTGWKPNAARLSVADNIMGQWEMIGNPVIGSKEQRNATFDAQSTYVQWVNGKYVFMADRWYPDSLKKSGYVWLPIEIEDDEPVIKWIDKWSL